MKKLFFFAATACVALASCVKNEPVTVPQDEITFAAPVVGVQTKVNGAIGTDYDTEESFDVWCVYNTEDIETWSGTQYFSNVTANYDETAGGWKLSTPYYWPATGQLSFVAMSPSITNTTTYDATNGFKITQAWSQGASEDDIVDLMYSEVALNKAKGQYGTNGEELTGDVNSYKGVDITFKHALSYLVFKVQTTADYNPTIFKLNKITLSGIYTTGTFTQKADDPWTEVTDDATKVGTYVAYTNTAGLSFDSTTAVDAAATTGCEMILLPQALVEDKQKIKVEYQISTDGTNWLYQVQEVDLRNSTVTSWEMGKKYTYTLSIGMEEILFDPAVSAWEDGGSPTITY